MNSKALRVLEFDKIKELLKSYTHTTAGKELIDNLQPYENIHEVREHLEETKEALELLGKKGSAPFEGIHDIRDAIGRVSKGADLSISQIYKVALVMRSARRFKEYIGRKEEEESYRVIEDICEGIVPLKKLEDEIFNALVGEEEISEKATDTLYNLRRSIKDKTNSIKDKVNSLVRGYSQYLQENIYTIRGERYVLPVKAEHKGSVPGLVHDQSSTGATLFIEPMSLVTLNNEIKELYLKEKAEVERILAMLSAKIENNINTVKYNSDILWELDFIFAKAKYASFINGICPMVNEDGFVDIIEGRHPLIDPKVVVPSSVYLGKEFTSLIITGPNTGGKTVTLKTVGLIHLMALSGILIPARLNSTVSFFKEIYADIGDEQSIEQSLSTFSSHMTNIVKIISEADINSLVLFDELGAGTDPTEGAALAVSILETLRKRSCKIVATTHYSELKAYALKTIGVENASVEFDVETLRPTYRLLIGVPGKSNAFEISKRLGLPSFIIEDAKNNISSDSLKFEDLIQSLQEKSIKAEEDARLAESIKLENKKLKEKYEEKLYKLQKHQENAMLEAQKQAKKVLKEAKEEADEILKNIRDFEKLGYSNEVRRTIEDERKKLKDKIEAAEIKATREAEIKGEALTSVKPGDEVFVPAFNQKAIVLSKPDNKGEVQVQAGIMKINVKLADLRKPQSSKEEKKIVKREARLNLKSVDSSVDLRGMDAEEAMYTADKYLDDAYLSGMKEVSIIHGKGTGVLRQSITDMLKRHPHVKKHRLGEYGEGGIGVTIVEIK